MPIKKEPGAAERYGVTGFDLKKKQAVIEASAPFEPTTNQGIIAFSNAVNELHFEVGSGHLVSEAEARMFAEQQADAKIAFENFLTNCRELIFGL